MSERKKYWHNIFILISAILIVLEYYLLLVHYPQVKAFDLRDSQLISNESYFFHPPQEIKYFLSGEEAWQQLAKLQLQQARKKAFQNNLAIATAIERAHREQARQEQIRLQQIKQRKILAAQAQRQRMAQRTRKERATEKRYNAPKPISAIRRHGKWVCAKKHDHPHKSKHNNKGKIHLDMECCLDPDEYPNPWCSYSSKNRKVSKYSFKDYLKKKKRKKHKKK